MTLNNLASIIVGFLAVAIFGWIVLMIQRAFYARREQHWEKEESHIAARGRVIALILERAKLTQIDGMIFAQWADLQGRVKTEQIKTTETGRKALTLHNDVRGNAIAIVGASSDAGETVRVLSASDLECDTERWVVATDWLVKHYRFTKKQGNGTYAPQGHNLLSILDLMIYNRPLPDPPTPPAQSAGEDIPVITAEDRGNNARKKRGSVP